jgi:hypothetical protein
MERALGGLAELAEKATPEPVGLSLFSAFAAPLLDLDHGKGQFMSGGAVLAPLRSSSIHPAKIVVLLGMKDGSFPVRGQSPGPELETKLGQKSERLKQQSEQRGMHAVILAIGAAQHRLIATFPGYAGATGKEANAALPVELIKQACNRLLAKEGGGLRIHRHGIHAHEAASGSKKEICEEKTYDTQALAAAAVLKQHVETTQGELIIRPTRPYETWAIDEWVEFWQNPAKGLFESLDLKTAWLEDELPADEALTPPVMKGKRTGDEDTAKKNAERWAKDFMARTKENPDPTSREPSLAAAKLSGHFSNLADDEDLEAVLDEVRPGGVVNWVEFMKDKYFQKEPTPLDEILPGVRSKCFPNMYFVDEWLVLTLPESKEVKDDHLFTALAMLAFINHKRPELRHVAIFGEKAQAKDGRAALGVMTLDKDDLFERFTTLAEKTCTSDYFLGRKATAKCVRELMTDEQLDDNSGNYADSIFGNPPYAQGDIHDKFGRLIAPAKFNQLDFIKTLQAVTKGTIRLTAKEVKDQFKSAPATKTKPAPKKPRNK